MLNQINLIGRVTKEIELKKTQSNKSVIKFTLAVDDGKRNDQKITQFIECQAWEGTADTIARYVKKGDMFQVSGKLINNNYESNGIKHYSYIVQVNGFTLLPNLRNEKSEYENKSFKRNELDVSSEFYQPSLTGDGKDLMGFDDDLPF